MPVPVLVPMPVPVPVPVDIPGLSVNYMSAWILHEAKSHVHTMILHHTRVKLIGNVGGMWWLSARSHSALSTVGALGGLGAVRSLAYSVVSFKVRPEKKREQSYRSQ